MKLALRWIIITVSLAIATWIVPGITVEPEANAILLLAAMAIVLGFINAFIRPLLNLLSCGCIVITMGLFLLITNALAFLLAAYIANLVGIGFYIDNFWSALLGSLIVSVVSFVLSMILIDD
jgi:putative membrane protein